MAPEVHNNSINPFQQPAPTGYADTRAKPSACALPPRSSGHRSSESLPMACTAPTAVRSHSSGQLTTGTEPKELPISLEVCMLGPMDHPEGVGGSLRQI